MFDMFNLNEKGNIGKHICQLRKTSGSTLPRLPPNAKIFSHLKRKFQKLIIVCDSHPYTNYLLRSQAAIAFEKRRHQSSNNWWIIHPCSKLRFCWDKLMTFVYLYFFIIVPYVKAFYTICGRKITYQYNLTIPAFAICLLDIIMNFITGYTLMNGSGIILDPSLIVRHYTQTYFLVDLFTSIPYALLTNFGNDTFAGTHINFIALIAELIPLLKIIRLSTFRHYIRQIHTDYGIGSVTDAVIWLSLLTALIFHWSACLTWGYPFLSIYATRSKFENSDVYAIKSNLYQKDSLQIYIMSLHMGISNLVGSSFIEFRKISHADKWIRCIILLFGTGYMIYLIAEPELKYQEIMRRMKEYIHEKNLPRHLGQKLLLYYEYRYQGSYFKENIIVSTLPNHLKQEINMRSNGGLLKTATIFHDLPESLVIDILSVVKPIIYLQDDIIYKFGDVGNCMYFIASGTVAIINFMGKEITHLEDGNHFGEICIIQRNNLRKVSVIAVETTELLRFDQRYFNRLVLSNSELYKRFLAIIDVRMKQINHANQISMDEAKQQRKRSSKYKRLLMRTGNLDPLSFIFSKDEKNSEQNANSSANTRSGSI
ncbi:hypothetical protein PV325_011847 [Microctonus aethiopoides]|nr:hypothetical protein PV325_011847 [Microctonus aethiopoides]